MQRVFLAAFSWCLGVKNFAYKIANRDD